jgi:hypothetical protein
MTSMRFQGALSVLMVTAAVVVGGAVAAGQAEDPVAKAARILTEVRKALGGEDKLAAITRLEAKGTVRRAAGEVNLEGDLEIAAELPNKYLRKESIILGGGGQGLDRTEGLNGTEAWETVKFGGGVNFDGDFGGGGNRGGGGGRPGGAADGRQGGADQRQVDPERQKEIQLRARQTEVARVLLATLVASESPVRWIGTAVSPQATAEVLEMQTADGTPTRLLIDSKTYMPLMLTWTGIPQDPLAALAGRAGFGRGRGRGRGGFGFPGRGQGGGGQGGQRGQQPAAGGAPTEARADALAQPTTLRMFLSEYKTVNGVKLPHLLVRGAGDQVTEEWVIRSYRINPNFKADTFSQ